MAFSCASFGEGFLERGGGLSERRFVLADGRQDVAGNIERPAFLLDLVKGGDLGAALDILEGSEPTNNQLAVFGVKKVLGSALSEETRSVDDEHLLLPLGRFRAMEDDDTAGEGSAVEKVWREADDCLDEVFPEQGFADLAFGALTEECALRKDDGHTAASALAHRRDHVLDEGVVPVSIRGQAMLRPAPGVVLPDLAAPFL